MHLLLGSQTLGEEYCDIMQYQVQSRKPPSSQVRLIALFVDQLTNLPPSVEQVS